MKRLGRVVLSEKTHLYLGWTKVVGVGLGCGRTHSDRQTVTARGLAITASHGWHCPRLGVAHAQLISTDTRHPNPSSSAATTGPFDHVRAAAGFPQSCRAAVPCHDADGGNFACTSQA